MAGNSSGKGELNKELPQSGLVLADVGIDLAVSALKIGVTHDSGTAVPGAGDVYHIEVVFLNDAVQMDIDEVLPGGSCPSGPAACASHRRARAAASVADCHRDKSGLPTDSWRGTR